MRVLRQLGSDATLGAAGRRAGAAPSARAQGREAGAARRRVRPVSLRDPACRIARRSAAFSRTCRPSRHRRASPITRQRSGVSVGSRRTRHRGLRRSPARHLAHRRPSPAAHDRRSARRRRHRRVSRRRAVDRNARRHRDGPRASARRRSHRGRNVLSRRPRASTRSSGNSAARCSFPPAAITITSARTPGRAVHPPPTTKRACSPGISSSPRRDDADAVARSVQVHGGAPSMIDNGWIVKDPWGTPVRIVIR